ncbi:hypothetical protein [Mitsuaria sp. GD03876]|uniref:hypothetical protein n=1 Tax=Mitsuaria sp. GD03876 TaxID=2975399 RepID=UPI002447CD7C|nr:hypothetical protein [Mitsuaria sp. GD03876]MDH0863232.1 hypothetical protein [Mitsuaria sp. GD03876]
MLTKRSTFLRPLLAIALAAAAMAPLAGHKAATILAIAIAVAGVAAVIANGKHVQRNGGGTTGESRDPPTKSAPR